MNGLPTTHWPPPPVMGSGGGESGQQQPSHQAARPGPHDYQPSHQQQQQHEGTYGSQETQPFQGSGLAGAASFDHERLADDGGSSFGWRGLVGAAHEPEQQQQHNGSGWQSQHQDYQQQQQLPPLNAYPSRSLEPSTAYNSSDAGRPSTIPPPRPLFEGGGPGPPEDYRVAFANLQRKQIELRLAEEHRRSREAELEILRLREIEHRRSSQSTSVYGVSARSSYSSGGAPVGLSAFPAANLLHGQPAPHFDVVSASTPSSTGSYSHGQMVSDDQDAGTSTGYQSYASPLTVPLPPSPAMQQDQSLYPPPPPGAYGIAPPGSFAYPAAPPLADGLSGPYNPRTSPPPSQDYSQRPSYAYHPLVDSAGPYPPPPPSAFAPPDQHHHQHGSSFTGLDFHGFQSVASVPPAPPLVVTRPSSPPPAKGKVLKRAARAATSKDASGSTTAGLSTPSSSAPPGPPAASSALAKKKRQLLQKQPTACCSLCAAPIAHLLLRGEDEHFKVDWEGVWVCKPCMGDHITIEDSGRRRKRTRSVWCSCFCLRWLADRLVASYRDTQDLGAPLTCDVCLQLKGKGGIIAKDSKSPILFSTEVRLAVFEIVPAHFTDKLALSVCLRRL